MMQRSFMISDEGDEYIRDQIRKKQDFFFFNSFFILAIVVVTGYLKLKVIDGGAILFGFCLFLVMMTLNLRHYFKFKKIKAHLVRSVQIDAEKIILATYGDYKYEPILYTLPLENNKLSKGLPAAVIEAEKPVRTEMLGIFRTYTLSSDQDPKNTFYLMSPFWPEWDEMYSILKQTRKTTLI
ncbi:hypothetical protein CPT03_07095 [Pedobacter ginsengisoli]|uniref:Uncharacterized protein n=1 Tax=Pedobacter ginsengisoli TaxID=363852 RepID=A0A2D1U3T2_9SPHI|nr:hypothetical protein [Pedobacter ginsengisoli]ATP56251.1 hypothetical protein CPT03_07095 [Pedobacter ginsengisoli]